MTKPAEIRSIFSTFGMGTANPLVTQNGSATGTPEGCAGT